MKLYAVESTNRKHLCQINACNITIFDNLVKAKRRAVTLATDHRGDKLRYRADIAFGEFLDGTMAAYDKSKGTADTAKALAFITKIEMED